MASKTWNFEIDGESHVVRLDWTYFGGRRKVFVNGELRDTSVIPLRWASTQRFQIGGRECVVRTEPGRPIWAFRISLDVDGRRIEPEPGSSYWEER